MSNFDRITETIDRVFLALLERGVVPTRIGLVDACEHIGQVDEFLAWDVTVDGRAVYSLRFFAAGDRTRMTGRFVGVGLHAVGLGVLAGQVAEFMVARRN